MTHFWTAPVVVVTMLVVVDRMLDGVVVVTQPSLSSHEISWPGSLGQSSSPSHLWTLQILWSEPGHAIWVSARHPLGCGRGWGILNIDTRYMINLIHLGDHLNTTLQCTPPICWRVRSFEKESCDPSSPGGLPHNLGELGHVRVWAGEEVHSDLNQPGPGAGPGNTRLDPMWWLSTLWASQCMLSDERIIKMSAVARLKTYQISIHGVISDWPRQQKRCESAHAKKEPVIFG